ncbi:reverse transcriptase domain, reverse transcriptase zinc-binding domain protein [Tanacetum coccineum]
MWELQFSRNTQNNGNQARGRAFSVNAVDALQDPNVVTGTFSLNDHFATVLFDYGADFSFISTKFAPLLNVKQALDEFKIASGLVPSLPKSTAYFCNVLNHVKLSILHVLPFEEGRLPVRYLGVLLVSSRLMLIVWKLLTLKRGRFGEMVPLNTSSRSDFGLSLWKYVMGLEENLKVTAFHSTIHLELFWIDCHGNSKKFSVSQVWDDIRMRDSKVKWYSMVWFPSCIPRHAIHLWLIIRRKLKTQDLIPAWDVSANLGVVCSLCDHMFFECSFSRGIWDKIKVFAGLDNSQPNIYSIINALLPIVKRRTTNCVIAKLVVAASAYFVWQERNWRMFQKGKRTIDQVVDCIKSVVRLKLLSYKMRKSKSGERLARLWDLPEAIFV